MICVMHIFFLIAFMMKQNGNIFGKNYLSLKKLYNKLSGL